MSFFSRDCLLRHRFPFQTTQALQHFFPQPNAARKLSSSPLLCAIKKAGKPSPPKSKPSFTPTRTSPGSQLSPTYKSYADILALKSHPTLLYEAPSHTLFMLSSYAAGAFCLAYSGLNFYSHCLYPPEGLNIYVVYAFGGIVVFMSALGTWLFLGPARLIKTITAIPKALTAQPITSLTRAMKPELQAVVATKPELHIEVELRKMFPIPFFPARKVYARPGEIVLERSLAPPNSANLTPEKRLQMKQAEENEKNKLMEYENTHIMTRGIRHMGRGAKELYRATARAWFRDGFLKARMKNGTYKLDISGGWALDNGRALDRLSSVKGPR